MKVWALYFENGYLFLSNKPFSKNGDKFYPPIDAEHTYFAVDNKEIKENIVTNYNIQFREQKEIEL